MFVPSAAFKEAAAAGSDAIAAVLPATAPLTGVYAPISDEPWLTVGSVDGGVVHFSYTQNTARPARRHLTVLGQTIAVTQAGVPLTSALLEGPAAGGDSDLVSVLGPWTAVANTSWLHTSSSGSGSGLARFTFDANTRGHAHRHPDDRRRDPDRDPGRQRLRGCRPDYPDLRIAERPD